MIKLRLLLGVMSLGVAVVSGCASDKPAQAPEPAKRVIEEGCQVSGCSGEICGDKSEESVITACLSRPEYACYRGATCGKDAQTGKCGWVTNAALEACLKQPPASTSPGNPRLGAGCVRAGCSGQLCISAAAAAAGGGTTTCEWKEIYACYNVAQCEKNAEGKCAWVETAELKGCLSGDR